MNERIKQIAASSLIIKQLAKQAEEYADIEYNASDLDWYELKEEKFAELIVAECTDLVQKYMTRWPEDHELTKQIKQHFGVEE